MRKKILFLTLMILICFTLNSVCAQSLDNINYADDGFDSDELIDCDLHKDSSQKSLKSNALSDKKTTNPVKLTDMKKAESNSVKQTDTAKASNTKSTSKSTTKTNATKSTDTKSNTTKSTATKTTANSSSTKKATQNITTINTQTLAKSSSSYMAYVEKNAKLQDPITISNKKYKSPEYLYLVSKAVSNISKTKVEIKDKLITNYSNSDCKSVNGTINKTEYVQIAKKTVSFIEKNHRAPNWIASSKGNIPRNQLILLFSKCLDQYNKSGKLPSSIKLNDLDLNKMKQKIDSSKKVNSTGTKKTNTSSAKTNSTSAKKTNTTSAKKTNTTATSTNNNKSLVESTLDSIKSILNNIENKLNPTNKVLSTTGTKKNTVTVNSSNVNVQISSSSTVNVKISAKDNTNSGKNTNSGSAKKTNTTSTKKTNTTSTKKTNTTSTKKTDTSSAKKTNTTSTKNNTSSAKKVNTSSSKTNTTAKNNTSATAKSSSNSKYLSTSVLNDKYLGESLKKYLAVGKNCQVTSKAIKTLANTLTSKLKSDYKKGEKIFNWVRDNIGYEKYRNTKKGALKTLKTRGGNCVDHAHLIVALSRAAGLPARYVNANNCKFSSGYVSGHVWAQVLVGNTWVVADATSNRNKFGVVKNWNVNSYKLVGKYSSISF